MLSSRDLDWIDKRIAERIDDWKKSRLKIRKPDVLVIDASRFAQQLSDLATTVMNKVDREGYKTIRHDGVNIDISVILRHLTHTYNLLRFINSDSTRTGFIGYETSYSFCALPLIRTLIDGFYNCTSLIDDPSRWRVFRISGYFRMRAALNVDEAKYANDLRWKQAFAEQRKNLVTGLRADGFTDADLGNKKNKWPLLQGYLETKPIDTPHKQILRKLTYGFWKEYSSISHSSYDGLVNIFPFIALDRATFKQKEIVEEAKERYIAGHFARGAGILVALLTEIQYFYKFDGASTQVVSAVLQG